MLHDFAADGDWLLIVLVMAGTIPELAASYQFLLIAAHWRRNHYGDCEPFFPRTAILIPAWNEAAVIGASIDRLMLLDYPRDALRVYVVDDASTDATPDVVRAKAAEPRKLGRLISPAIIYVVGYGSLLCACTFASYVKELRKAEMKWDKTEKTGKVTIPG